MQVELWFGDSAVMLADEFPEFGSVPGGARTVLISEARGALNVEAVAGHVGARAHETR